jgi:hypothetical protein
MIASNKKVVVSVDFSQKKSSGEILLAKNYSHNRRESNPVLCIVENGNMYLPKGTLLLVHHNRFVENSPHHLGGNLYSLAYNSSIFAKIDSKGKVHGLCGNVLVEYIYDNNELTPEHLKKPNEHKYKVISNGFGYKKGEIVFAFPFADYEIVYVFNGNEQRVVKIVQNDIIGKII